MSGGYFGGAGLRSELTAEPSSPAANTATPVRQAVRGTERLVGGEGPSGWPTIKLNRTLNAALLAQLDGARGPVHSASGLTNTTSNMDCRSEGGSDMNASQTKVTGV
jgi:hypothetical protein